MEFTNDQKSMNGRAQNQSVGTNAAVGHKVVLLASPEAHNTGQEKIPSFHMGDEVNSHPAFRAAPGSSNDKTKFERLDDRVSRIRCTVLAVSIL